VLCKTTELAHLHLPDKAPVLSSQRLGHYDPLKKETNLNAPAIKKWLEVGAIPSDTVSNLLKKAMVIE
jgi:ribosomal protein S16